MTRPCASWGMLTLAALALAAFPILAQDGGRYRIELLELDQKGRCAHVASRDKDGKPALFVTLQFKILRAADGRLADDINKEEIVVEEDGRRVTDLDLHQPGAFDRLTTVLAIDCSGSMAEHGKMAEAKRAARLFLGQLHARADCGLILFDHELRDPLPPALDPNRIAVQRRQLQARLEAAQPSGGTAYLDATARALAMLKNVPGRKAVLLMTDGVDLNSTHNLTDVTQLARAIDTPVYTLGVGEPGKQEPVTTVLVLDHSGSMREPASAESKMPKIAALHQAASRFTSLMRPGAATTLLPFSSEVESPQPFTSDKTFLGKRLSQLKPEGETALFDATYAAVETLVAARRPGKGAVVVLTDGIDNRSRHRPEDVIARAKAAHIPVHLLGFGRPGELNEEVMRQIATATGGSYHHARTEQMLFHIFEDLSVQLHDDGYDEKTLRQLAEESGGKFYDARDVSRLHLIYQELADELQNTYTVTFPSQRPTHDGTARGIDIHVVRQGRRVSDVASANYQVHGVVVPEMDHRVYLGLLTVLGLLLVLPAGLKRWFPQNSMPETDS